jgi:hypothetical protein
LGVHERKEKKKEKKSREPYVAAVDGDVSTS